MKQRFQLTCSWHAYAVPVPARDSDKSYHVTHQLISMSPRDVEGSTPTWARLAPLGSRELVPTTAVAYVTSPNLET